LTEEEVLEVFRESSALLSGHFKLSSGKHSDTYLQCALVLADPARAEKLCTALAQKWSDVAIDTVIGPALGGVVVAYELARALGARGIFAERKDGAMMLRRGFSVSPGERVLLVEDVVTTGGSALEVVQIVKATGAELAGVSALIDRGGGKAFPCRFEALANVQPPLYDPDRCPLCERGEPITTPGSRAGA